MAQGRVQTIDDSKTGVNKFGKKWTLYKVQIDGVGWLSAGFDRPSFSVGQTISFTVEDTPKGKNILKGSVTVVEGAPAPAQGGSAPAPEPHKVSDDPRQVSIVMQHSQEMAISFTGLLLTHNALPLSASAGKAGEAKREKELRAIVQKLTVMFYNDAVSGRLLKFVADTLPTADETPGQIPGAKQPDADELGDDA